MGQTTEANNGREKKYTSSYRLGLLLLVFFFRDCQFFVFF